MTGRYGWNALPHVLDVRCPACAKRATFEFAEVVRIRRRGDVPMFAAHPQLEVRKFSGTFTGGNWQGAMFFPGLRASSTASLRGLPEGYEASEWKHSKYFTRSHGLDLGAVVCASCGLHRKRTLQWPDDAWWQIAHRGQGLWAFHRETAMELLNFVQSTTRDRAEFRWRSFLLHVPSAFLTASARPHVVRKLQRLLDA